MALLPESVTMTQGDRPTVAVELLIDESKIQDRLKAMGRQIEEDYRDKPLTIVAVLTGSLIALADLVRQIRIPLRIALVQASSYRGATTTATTLVVNEAFAHDVAGRDVLLLDDILDTGRLCVPWSSIIKDRAPNRPNRRAPPQDRPPDRRHRARLLWVRHPRRVRRRLRPGLQRRVSPFAVCRRASRMKARPLKLALVTRRYPPLIGGAEKVLSYLAVALAAEGA